MAPVTTTPSGAVAGEEELHRGRLLYVYRGIPYAEPPVGARRWQPPEARRPWSGTREARAFGLAAPQFPSAELALPAAALDAGPTSEDCLTLNIWAPAGATGLPVMVWVHGGSFLTGSSAMPSYDGSVLAAEGNVVVVSINYRLGALGFAPVAGHSNLGLLDQLLALGWVREGIEAFGGDPDLVTVFGESAGGGSILHLLARPEARLLFRRAIVQSGATNLSLTTEQAGEVADRVRTALGGSDPVRAPVAAILEAQGRVLGELATVAIMAYHPVGTLEDLAPVDLLIGTTADEMRLFLDDASWTLGEAHFRKRAVRYLASAGLAPPEAQTLLAAYADLPTPTDQWAALRNDVELWLPTVDVATAHVERGATTYCYRFDWPAGVPNERVGACHGIDIPFTFGTLDRCGWDAFVGGVSEAEGLSVSIRGAWVAFATNGDPSTEGTGPWPAYGTPERATMVLDRENRLLGDPRGEVRRAWDVARSVPAP